MGKTIYTEQDIEDLARQGKRSLEVTEEILLTELAVEKARQLGITLENRQEAPPSAPVRPYLVSKPMGKSAAKPPASPAPAGNGLASPLASAASPASGAGVPQAGANLPKPAPPAAEGPKKFPEPVLAPLPSLGKPDLRQRIASAVSARLGGELDPALLDRVIGRILDNIETK